MEDQVLTLCHGGLECPPGWPCGSCQLLKTHPQGKERWEWGLPVALAQESFPFIRHLPVPAVPALSSAGSAVGR